MIGGTREANKDIFVDSSKPDAERPATKQEILAARMSALIHDLWRTEMQAGGVQCIARKKPFETLPHAQADFRLYIQKIIQHLDYLKESKGIDTVECQSLLSRYHDLEKTSSIVQREGDIGPVTDLLSASEAFMATVHLKRGVAVSEVEFERRVEGVWNQVGLGQRVQQRSSSAHKPLPRQVFQLLQTMRQENVSKATEIAASSALSSQKNLFERVLGARGISVTNRHLYHVAGDPIGALSRELIGFDHNNSLTFFADMLHLIASTETPEIKTKLLEQEQIVRRGLQFARDLRNAKDLSTFSTTFNESLSSLGVGQSLLIPGGWEGNPGHAMVYEVKKSNALPGKFEVIIHNSGKGIERHSQREVGGRRMVASLRIDGVSGAKLSDPAFLQVLQELQTLPLGTEWSDKHVYEAMVSSLSGTIVEEAPLYSDIQRSGTCCFASVFLYMQSKLPEKEYERFRLAMEIKSIDSVARNKDEWTENTLPLLLKCLQYTSQRLVQCETKGFISGSELVCVQKVISDTDLKVQKALNVQNREQSLLCVPPHSLMGRLFAYVKSILRKIGLLRVAPEHAPPLSVEKAFDPEIPFKSLSFQELSSSRKACALFETKPPLDVTSAVVLVKKAILWASNQSNSYETHIELGRIIKMVHEAIRKDAASINRLQLAERMHVIHELSLLGRWYGNGLMDACRERGAPLHTHPSVFTAYCELIDCAKLMGKGVEEIDAYPTTMFSLVNRKDDLYYSFESAEDEERFFQSVSSQKGSDEWYHEPISTNISRSCHTIGSERDSFDALLGILAEKFGTEALEKFSHNSAFMRRIGTACSRQVLGASLLDTELEPIARTILPTAFFDLKNLVDSAVFLMKHHDVMTDMRFQGQTTRQWKVENKQDRFELSEDRWKEPKKPLFSAKDVLMPPMQEHLLKDETYELCRESPYDIATKLPKEPTAPSFQAYLRLIPSKRELQIDSAVALFSSHPELFLHREWRVFFERIVFNYSVFRETADGKMKTIPAVIATFLEQQLRLAVHSRDADRSIFFLRQYRMLFERVEHRMGQPERAALKKTMARGFVEVHEMIRGIPNNGKYQLLWHYERAQHLRSLKTPSPLDVDALIVSTLYCRRVVSQEEPALEYDVRLLTHDILSRDSVKDRFAEAPQQLISKSLSFIPEEGAVRQWRYSHDTVYASDTPKQVSYDLLLGEIADVRAGSQDISTPSFISTSPSVQQALGGTIPPSLTEESFGLYTFTQNGTDWKIVQRTGVLAIYKKVGNEWFQYVENHAIEEFFCSVKERRYNGSSRCVLPEYIFHRRNVWVNEHNSIIRFENHSGVGEYEVEFAKKGVALYVCDSKGKRTQTQVVSPLGLPQNLLAVEEYGYILPLSKNGTTIDEIQFPRLGGKGLRFCFDAKKSLWRNADNPHEILSGDQYVQVVGQLQHKLLLVDERTREKRILVPGHHLWSANEQSALSTGSILYKSPSEERVPLYSYRKEKGSLVAESAEGTTYLAYTYLWQQQYEESAKTLDRLQRLPLSNESMTILSWMVNVHGDKKEKRPGHDFDARSSVIVLKAAAALMRQKELFQRTIPKLPLEGLFQKYLGWRHLCGNVFLTPEELSLLGETTQLGEVSITQTKPFLRRIPTLSSQCVHYFLYKRTASLLNPSFTDQEFKNLYRLLSLSREEVFRKGHWKEIQELIKGCFRVSLSDYSPKEWGRLKKILSIAARLPPSLEQTATAVLYAVTLEPEKFQGEMYPGEQVKVAQSIFGKEEPPAPEKMKVSVEVEPKVVSQGPSLAVAESSELIDPWVDSLAETAKKLFQQKPLKKTSERALFFAHEITGCLRDQAPITRTMCAEFENSVKQFQKMGGVPFELFLDPQQLTVVINQLSSRSKVVKEATREWKKRMRDILARKSAKECLKSQQGVLEAAHFMPTVGIEEAVMCLIKPFPDGFLELNPAFVLEDAKELLSATVNYLLHKTYQQHLQTVLQAARPIQADLEKGKQPVQEECQALFTLLQAKRSDSFKEFPQYLVFESAFGHFLRPDQIANLGLFLSGKEGASKVLEIPMGAGKTSALVPIVSKVVAQRGKLAVVILPESLYPSMAPQIAQTLQRSFATKVFSWELESNEAVSLETLKAVDVGLKRALEEQEVVIIKPKDLTGLLLHFITTVEELPDPKALEKVKLYQSIFRLLTSSSELLCDEFDTVCDVLKEHVLSVGDLVSLDKATIQVSATLQKMLLTGEFHVNEPEAFRRQVAPSLIKKFVATVPHKYAALITAYLEGKKDKADIAHLPSELRDTVAVARAQIQDILPETHTKVLGIHYGEEDGVAYAIPYENGQPVHHSRCGHELEEVNYTISMICQLPITRLQGILQPIFEELTVQARKEMQTDRGLPLSQTSSYLALESIVGSEVALKALSHSVEEGVVNITLALQKDKANIISFVEKFILPSLKRPNTFARTSSQIYAQLCSILRGFSGTLWNKDSYPIPSIQSPESVGKTIAILAEEPSEVTVFSSKEKTPLFQPDHAIIDIGGVLKDEDGEQVAQNMLAVSNPDTIHGVVFYGKDGKSYVLERKKQPYPLDECTIPPEHLSAFWAQAFTTGSDLKVRRTTEGCADVSKDTILRDLVQGVWRLRKLGKGQKVQFLIESEAKTILCQSLGLPLETTLQTKHIIAFVLQSQVARLSTENYRSVRQKANAILERGFLSFLFHGDPAEFHEAFSSCKDIFVQKKPASPFELYGTKAETMSTDVALKKTFEKVLTSPACTFLCEKGVLNRSQVSAELSALEGMRQVLPDQVVEIVPETNTRVHVQTQTRTQTRTTVAEETVPPKLSEVFSLVSGLINVSDVERDLFRERSVQGPVASDSGIETGCSRLNDIFLFHSTTSRWSNMFSRNVGTSINLHQVTRPGFTPLTRYSQPYEYALVIKGDYGYRLVAVNQHDAEEVFSGEYVLLEGNETALVNIRSGELYPIHCSEETKSALDEDFSFLIDRVSLKVFSGDLSLSSREQVALLAWCARLGKNGVRDVRDFLTTIVSAIWPEASSAEALVGSLLADNGKKFLLAKLDRVLERSSRSDTSQPSTSSRTTREREDMKHEVMALRRLIEAVGNDPIPIDVLQRVLKVEQMAHLH